MAQNDRRCPKYWDSVTARCSRRPITWVPVEVRGGTRLGITQALTFPQDCFAGIVQILTKLRLSATFIDRHELNATRYRVPYR